MKLPRLLVVIVLTLALLPLGPARPLAAASLRLNAPLAVGHTVQGDSVVVTPNGQQAVFLGDLSTRSLRELYRVPVAGGQTVKLNHVLVPESGSIDRFLVSSDGLWVVYALRPGSRVTELWSVPITGGVPSRLTPPLPSDNSGIGTFRISPVGGGQVIYVADLETPGRFELYRVPIAGGSPVKRSAPLAGGTVVAQFEITSSDQPAGARIVYSVSPEFAFQLRTLISVPILTGNPVTLTNAVAGGEIDGFTITPDDTRVVFSGDVLVDGQQRLFWAPIDGSSVPVRLDDLPADDTRDVVSFQVKPDSSRAVFVADKDADGKYELFSAPLVALPTVQRINSPLPANDRSVQSVFTINNTQALYLANVSAVDRFDLFVAGLTSADSGANLSSAVTGATADATSPLAFSPNGDHRLFLLRDSSMTPPVYDLYSKPLGANPPVKINRPDLGLFNNLQGYQVVDDGGTFRAIYLAADTTPNQVNLHSVTLDGPVVANKMLNVPLPGPGTVSKPVVVPGSNPLLLLFTTIQPGSDAIDLFRVPASGASLPVRLTSATTTGGAVQSFQLSPDGSRVVYLADGDRYRRLDLYSRPLLGGPITRLTIAPVDGSVFRYAISPNGAFVVFITQEKRELWSVPIAGGTPVRLTGEALLAGSYVAEFRVAPNSSRVVFLLGKEGSPTSIGLHSVPTDGSAPYTTLFSATGVAVGEFTISGDSGLVAYLVNADAGTPGMELWRVAITGGSSVRLSGMPTTDVVGFRAAPNGTTLVYLADETVAGAYDLYSVPYTGGSRQRLSALTNGRTIFSWEIATSDRVVYRANQTTSSVVELYSAPLTGGPTRIAAMPASGSVEEFVIDPAGDRVVFRADRITDQFFELWSVPITGGVDPIRLGGVLPAGSAILQALLISPDGSRVIYRRSTNTGTIDLYSASLNGGDPVQLSPSIPGGGSVNDFLVSPNGANVLVTVFTPSAIVYELYQVPIGGGPAERINGPLVNGGIVLPGVPPVYSSPLLEHPAYAYTPDSRFAIYLADQLTNNVQELFLANAAPVTVQFAAATATTNEGAGSVGLTVGITGTVLVTATVAYTVTGGTAGNSSDYALPGGLLTFPPGVPTTTLTIGILQDTQREGDETVSVSLISPTNATIGSPSSLTVTIIDDEPPVIYVPLAVRASATGW